MTISLPSIERVCLDCHVVKPVSEFHGKGKTAKGIKKYQSYCRPCANKRRRVREKNDPLFNDKRKKYMKKANDKRTPEQRKKEPSYSSYFKDIKKIYGLTKEEYQALLTLQNNSCAICQVNFTKRGTKRKPHIDHDHVTGRIRGVLCGPCNMGIGQLKDSIDIIESALKYLKNSCV